MNPAPAEAKAETAADTFADFEDSWEKTEAEAKVAQEKAFKRWRVCLPLIEIRFSENHTLQAGLRQTDLPPLHDRVQM